MADTKHLIKRGDLFMFNWRVPKDCHDIFNGKKYITKSLKTHSLREAKYRRNQMLAEIENQIQEYRHGETDSEVYRALVKQLLTFPRGHLEGAWDSVTYKLEKLIKQGKEPDLTQIQDRLVSLSGSSRDQLIAQEMQKAYLDMIEDPDERMNAKALQDAYLGIQHDLINTSLKEALELHIRDNGQRVKPNTISQTKYSVSRFLTSLNKEDIALKSITRRDVKDFISVALKERAGSTVGNYVTFLSIIWEHARDLELIDGSSPFKGHKIDTKPKQSYELLTDDELKTIFEATERFKGHNTEHYKYLLPRLGYVTGCRIEELCSLKCNQVITNPETNITYIEVLDGKTDNAKRKIPLHDWVADEVVAQRNKVITGLLFPTLTTQRNDGKHGDKVSKWFGRLKRDHGMTQRSTAFHSFRVHVATNLERGNVPESTAVWILGHTRNLSLSYGLYSKGMDLKQLMEAILVITEVMQIWHYILSCKFFSIFGRYLTSKKRLLISTVGAFLHKLSCLPSSCQRWA